MGIDESTLFFMGGFIFGFITLLQFTLLLYKQGSFTEQACGDSRLRCSLVTLLPITFRNTWSQRPGVWIFIEVKCIQMNAHTHTHTEHTHTNMTIHTPICNIFSPKEMARFSWDIPNRLKKLLKKRLPWHGFGLELMKRSTVKTPHWPERGCWVWEEVGAQPRQMSSCALRSLYCTPLVSTRYPLLQDSEVVMAPGRWLRNGNKKRKGQKFCPQNWGFLITSSLVIKLETYRNTSVGPGR